MNTGSLKLFWDNILRDSASTVSVNSTSATSDFSIDYIHNDLEVNGWAESSGSSAIRQILVNSAGFAADYWVIHGHNANGATFALDASSDNFAASTVAIDSGTINSTGTFMRLFDRTTTYTAWRLTLDLATSTQLSIKLLSIGTASELGYIQPPFDPYSREINASVNVSQGGYVTGIHEQFTERTLSITMNNQDTSVSEAIQTWINSHGPKNVFLNWGSTSDSTVSGTLSNVWLVRPDLKFNHPINIDGYRDITLNFKGRKV